MSDSDSTPREGGLESFRVYQKALKVFDLVVEDCAVLRGIPECYRLIGQHVASADSVPSNIEEGYGRESSVEYARFLVIARGSAQETRGRYTRFKHWLPDELIRDRVDRIDEIIAGLTNTIRRLRAR